MPDGEVDRWIFFLWLIPLVAVEVPELLAGALEEQRLPVGQGCHLLEESVVLHHATDLVDVEAAVSAAVGVAVCDGPPAARRHHHEALLDQGGLVPLDEGHHSPLARLASQALHCGRTISTSPPRQTHPSLRASLITYHTRPGVFFLFLDLIYLPWRIFPPAL